MDETFAGLYLNTSDGCMILFFTHEPPFPTSKKKTNLTDSQIGDPAADLGYHRRPATSFGQGIGSDAGRHQRLVAPLRPHPPNAPGTRPGQAAPQQHHQLQSPQRDDHSYCRLKTISFVYFPFFYLSPPSIYDDANYWLSLWCHSLNWMRNRDIIEKQRQTTNYERCNHTEQYSADSQSNRKPRPHGKNKVNLDAGKTRRSTPVKTKDNGSVRARRSVRRCRRKNKTKRKSGRKWNSEHELFLPRPFFPFFSGRVSCYCTNNDTGCYCIFSRFFSVPSGRPLWRFFHSFLDGCTG